MRAVFLSGGIYHDFDALTAATAGVLATAGFESEITRSPADLVAALARQPADLVVVQALRWRMLGHEKYEPFRAEWAYAAGEDLITALSGHVAAGRGLIALHTGCICFDDWAGWAELLGGGWVWGQSFHAPGLEEVRITPLPGHPVTEGLAPFAVTDEHYRDLALHPSAVILAEGQTAAGISHPVAWARGAGLSGRSVTLTIGHDLASLTVPGQARLIRQAALWAARQSEGTKA